MAEDHAWWRYSGCGSCYRVDSAQKEGSVLNTLGGWSQTKGAFAARPCNLAGRNKYRLRPHLLLLAHAVWIGSGFRETVFQSKAGGGEAI